MELNSLNRRKHDLGHLAEKPYGELTDAEAEKLIDILFAENLAPRIEELPFNQENVNKLLNLSKCRQCGRCCQPNKTIPDHPGIIVFDSDLEIISRKTKHNLKSLHRIAEINDNPSHNLGERYLPLPCLFFNKNEKTCKIYPFRPLICRSFPISNCDSGDITISLRCDYGKDIFRNLIKSMRTKTPQ